MDTIPAVLIPAGRVKRILSHRPEPACGDGIDNDGDGYVDLADPGCLAADDADEFPANAVPACKDGLDNDADGLVDLDDADCGSDASRQTELSSDGRQSRLSKAA